MYPNKLPLIKNSVESIGIWEAIRQQFIKLNQGSEYNKPYVKICFYSVLFGGGAKAMINGIMEKEQKALGITPNEFKELPEYEVFNHKAVRIASIVNNLPIFKEFRQMSDDLKKQNKGKSFVGPTGNEYPINDEVFGSSFSNYLQSFEFPIIAVAMVEVMKQFPTSELLYHFHDKALVSVKIDEAKNFQEALGVEVKSVGDKLGLKFPQKIEVKTSYPPNIL